MFPAVLGQRTNRGDWLRVAWALAIGPSVGGFVGGAVVESSAGEIFKDE